MVIVSILAVIVNCYVLGEHLGVDSASADTDDFKCQYKSKFWRFYYGSDLALVAKVVATAMCMGSFGCIARFSELMSYGLYWLVYLVGIVTLVAAHDLERR